MTFSFRTRFGRDYTFPIEKLHQIKPIKSIENGVHYLLEITLINFIPEKESEAEFKRRDELGTISFEAVIFQINRPEFPSGWEGTKYENGNSDI